MPMTGGKCRKLCALTAMLIVKINMPTTIKAPSFNSTFSLIASGFSLATNIDMITAGINQLTTEGMIKAKNVAKGTTPFCQTIKVVISPNGLNAPPALAATTILIQASAINLVFVPPTAIATVDINNAVVRLSAIGDKRKEITPVIQKIVLNENP